MSNLQMQIKETIFKAMQDLLEKNVNNDKLNAKDIDWLISLCSELKTRINKLTPSRKDLHTQLNSAVDVQLIKQMLENNAFETKDAIDLINFVFEHRLKKLCAPCQDEKVAEVHEKILNCENFGKQISYLIMESNIIIDEIEKLHTEFMQGSIDS